MFNVQLRQDSTILIVEINGDTAQSQYAFYLNKNGSRIAIQWYSNSPKFEFDCKNEPGIYSAVGFLKDDDGQIHPKNSNSLAIRANQSKGTERKIHVAKRTIRLKEQSANVDRLCAPNGEQLLNNMGGLEDKKYRIRTDSSGFIVTGNDRNSRNKTIVIGDSFVESMFVDEHKRFCSIIESMDIQNGTDYFGHVLNAGCSGSTTLNLYNCLVNKVFSNPPQRLLFVLPANDAYAHRYTSTYWNSSAYYANILPADIGKAESELKDYSILAHGSCSKLLLLIINACHVFGVELAFATFPHVTNYSENDFLKRKYRTEDWFLKVCAARKLLNDTIRRISRTYSIDLVDFEEKIEGSEENFYDELHLNEKGSLRVAELIYATLGSGQVRKMSGLHVPNTVSSMFEPQ